MKDMPSPRWRKSSHSDHSGGNCIEVADLDPRIGVRDSKNPHGPKLIINRHDFRRLTKAINGL